MMNGLSALISAILPKSRTNVQSANISGDNNTVEQHIHVSLNAGDNANREWLTQAISGQPSQPKVHEVTGLNEGDEQEEIKRIVEYRQIATDGDSETALKLLGKLQSDEKYKSGFVAFRLYFNIGIIEENIGNLAAASASLRTAYSHAPDDKKAQTGLALAELNDGQAKEAFERAKGLAAHQGDHQSLAVVVALYSAIRTGEEFDIEDYSIQDPDNHDIVAANLEYIRATADEKYSKSLDDAHKAHPANGSVATMWAQDVLDDAQQNQAFILGAKTADAFEERLSKSADILRSDLEASLKRRPPNMLLLPSQANNTAVALRLSGNVADAAKLLDRVIEEYPALKDELAQVRAVLFLQEDRDYDAFKFIEAIETIPELQVMASEIEAKMGKRKEALARINETLKKALPDALRSTALLTKARIAINSSDRAAADEAIDELSAIDKASLELVLVRSAYSRAFELISESDEIEQLPIDEKDKTESDRKLLESLKEADGWDFLSVIRAADELLARGYYRACADLLRHRVSFSKESPALQTLCDACVRGGLGTTAKEIVDQLSSEVKNSVFGWKFIANASYLHGEAAKAVPVTRKLFENNSKSISALEWYIQSLLRMNDKARIKRVVADLIDSDMVGTIDEKREYVNFLVFCGEVERARTYAYQLFCENRNDHKAWMALSSSVLAFGKPPGTSDDLHLTKVEANAAFEVSRADGTKQTYILEEDKRLFLLRDENIAMDHPIAVAALGKQEGEIFPWPFGKGGESATITSIKHKVLDAFHYILRRFEEQFPDASGFKSVSIAPDQEGGLDEMKALLQQRAEYSQEKANEYRDGSYPLPILGFHLGIDPIDAFLGLKRECNVAPKVSSCSHVDQEKASISLKRATKVGIIADPVACYLLRRLGIEKDVEREFGRLGVTQNTLDIFAKRLQEAEQTSFFEAEDGTKHASTIAVHNGNLVISESTDDEVKSKIDLLRSDLEWLTNDCDLLPTIAREEPAEEIIRFRNRDGGRFFDDILAADGSGRLLLSDDFHLRQWAEGLFGVQSAWLQSLLFHLEEVGQLETEAVVRSTIHLVDVGEEALSLNSARLATAFGMLSSGELSTAEVDLFCSLLGQPGAEIRSHIPVAASAIVEIWSRTSLATDREKAASVILRMLLRNQTDRYKPVLYAVRRLVGHPQIADYIDGWQKGHFLI
ncbi:PIN domain-containing protein [Agrobacterium leguminum]|uniref:PIN domain-containing protein n=1 Tax=Agrobacterium leguminum TaxID=2792015 RepID=UPI003CE4D489